MSDLFTLRPYYLTFGFGQPHSGCYTIIEAISRADAHRQAQEKLGLKWSMLYDEEGWTVGTGVTQDKAYHLQLLPFHTL